MEIPLTLSVPIGFFQFITCNISQSSVSNAVLMCVCAVCRGGEWWFWGRLPLDSLQIHSCLVSQGWGMRVLVRSLYIAQSLLSSSSFLSAMKDVTTCTKTHIRAKSITDTASENNFVLQQGVNICMYLQENHQTIPRLRDVQGLSYLNPPRTSDPLF